MVIELCREAEIPVFEKNFSLTEVYSAEEAFITGTFAGLAPVTMIDGREISPGRGPMVERLQQLYAARIAREAHGARP
jgi:branched-chain amino acid aminotransferase